MLRFQYRPVEIEVSLDLFAAALDAEGIPCDGRFYEAVYRSDLFHAEPETSPQLYLKRAQPVDYTEVYCPVWVPQFVLLGDNGDVEDIGRAVAKVSRNLADLADTEPTLSRHSQE